MTRKEEISQMAEIYAHNEAIGEENRLMTYRDFVNGAEQADKTMIDKACQWIESYLFDIGFPDDWCRDSATMKSGKQRFLEAMEE